MGSVAKFKKWHSERMGHPIGVLLAVEAIGDLEHRVNYLDSCAKTSNSRVVELKKDNDRLVEENAELREALVSQLKVLEGYKNLMIYPLSLDDDINTIKKILNK